MDQDTALMLRVKHGDRKAFELLWEKYQQPIIALLSRLLGDATEAQDLAQIVFVKVFVSANRFRFSAKFSTWLYTIARNVCLNEIRRRSRHRLETLDDQLTEYEDAPWQLFTDRRHGAASEAMLQEELRQKIEEAVAALPEDQRMAILLFREEELSYNDIALTLGISLAATKSLIHRGRQSLKQKLIPYLSTGVWHRPMAISRMVPT